ncbi:Aldo/keto reductase [Penicillium viridicatum]|nr:Aldo/keto reductase [Penicillium viridicatum]
MRIIPVFYITYHHATGSGEACAGIMGSINKASAFKLLDAFYEAGGNFIDTANVYQNEHHAIGKGPHAANLARNSRHSIHVSVRNSLKKLRTDYIDIYYVHYWDFTTPIKEVMDALHILVEQGKVLYPGALDTPAWIVAAANTYANHLNRDFERDIIPMAREFGIALAPWDVLDGGKFQYKAEFERRKATRKGLCAFAGRSPHLTEEEIKVSEALEKIVSEHGIDSVTSVTLVYVMSKAGNVFPLTSGRKVEHLEGNAQALSLKQADPGANRTFRVSNPSTPAFHTISYPQTRMLLPNAQKPTSL